MHKSLAPNRRLAPRVDLIACSGHSRKRAEAAEGAVRREGVVVLELIMGNYSVLALLNNSFDSDHPSGTEPLLPV